MFQDTCFLKSFFAKLSKLNPFLCILKLHETIENSSKKDIQMEAIVEKKRSSRRPVEIMEDQIKYSRVSRSFSAPLNPIIYHTASNCSTRNVLSCPNILNYKSASRIISEKYFPNTSNSHSSFDIPPNNSCSSSPTATFITAPDTTPVRSISSWGSCRSRQSLYSK